jgi:hypothetical protein
MKKSLATLFVCFCLSLVTCHSPLLFGQFRDYLVQEPQFSGVIAPAAPTATAVVGQYNYAGFLLPSTLPVGTYNVYLTYVDAAGNESKVSSTAAVTTTAADPAIYVAAPGNPNAGRPVSYNVYICVQSSGTCTSETLQNSAALLPSQGYYQSSPLLTVTSPPSANTKFPYTAGSVYFGGGAPTSIAAGSVTLSGGAYNNCAALSFSSCGFVYFNGTTLAWTATLGTATAAGSFPLWAVTTDATSTALTVVPFSLMPPAAVPIPVASLAAAGAVTATTGSIADVISTQTPGTTRVLVGSAELSYLGIITIGGGGGNVVGVRGVATLDSGATLNAGYVYGTQGKAVVTGTLTTQSGGGIVSGIFGQLDLTSATLTNAGDVAAGYFDMGSAGTAASIANLSGIGINNSTSVVAGQAIRVATTSSGFTNLFRLDDTSGTLYSTCTTFTAQGYINISLGGTSKKIPYGTCS